MEPLTGLLCAGRRRQWCVSAHRASQQPWGALALASLFPRPRAGGASCGHMPGTGSEGVCTRHSGSEGPALTWSHTVPLTRDVGSGWDQSYALSRRLTCFTSGLSLRGLGQPSLPPLSRALAGLPPALTVRERSPDRALSGLFSRKQIPTGTTSLCALAGGRGSESAPVPLLYSPGHWPGLPGGAWPGQLPSPGPLISRAG